MQIRFRVSFSNHFIITGSAAQPCISGFNPTSREVEEASRVYLIDVEGSSVRNFLGGSGLAQI